MPPPIVNMRAVDLGLAREDRALGQFARPLLQGALCRGQVELHNASRSDRGQYGKERRPGGKTGRSIYTRDREKQLAELPCGRLALLDGGVFVMLEGLVKAVGANSRFAAVRCR